jgi:hypothetical protein
VALVATARPVPARAASFGIDWLDMSATGVGAEVASGSVYVLPGYGDVQIDYTSALPATPQPWRRNVGPSGSLAAGPDTYTWGAFDALNGVNGFGGEMTRVYTITFSFLDGPVDAGKLVLGTYGLGRNDVSEPSDPKTFVQVFQPGTNLGDSDLGPANAPTLFTPIIGGFQLENSVLEPGAGFFNTDHNVVRIDTALSSLVLNVTHIDEDGISFSVGLIVSEPASALLLGSSALLLLGARRGRPRRG